MSLNQNNSMSFLLKSQNTNSHQTQEPLMLTEQLYNC